jgi:hypothetical protein
MMIEALTEVTAMNDGVLSALTHLRNGSIEIALAKFAKNFCFTDRARGLHFTDKDRLREFILKERELHLDSSFQLKKSVVTENHVIAGWLLEYTSRRPYNGSVLRDVFISVQGISFIHTSKGKICNWSDYYDKPSPFLQP